MKYEDYSLFCFINRVLAVDNYIDFEYGISKDSDKYSEFCFFTTSALFEYEIFCEDQGSKCSINIYKNYETLLSKENINLFELNFILSNEFLYLKAEDFDNKKLL